MSGDAPLLAVLDYGMGNRRSVQKALEHVGASTLVTSAEADLDEADGIVLPGVGAFPRAMENLRARKLDEILTRRVGEGVPLLGVCLGMQLLFEGSEELGGSPGLGLLAGEVSGLSTGGLRVPHIGWNQVTFERASPLTAGLPPSGCPMYHVHSLAARPADPGDVVGHTEYGERFATIVQRESVFGVQFHPEKSSRHGLQMLAGFLLVCRAARGSRLLAAAPPRRDRAQGASCA